MKGIAIKILKNTMIGIGISMIIFLLISKVFVIDNSKLLSLSFTLFILGLIGGASTVTSDYLRPLIYVALHFLYTFISMILVLGNYEIINIDVVSVFYLFEIVFTLYIIYAILLFIKDTINGTKINEKLGLKNNKTDNLIFISKVLIILGVVWNILFDLLISIVSSILIVSALLFLLYKKVKTKYEVYCIIVTSFSLLISIFLLASVITVTNSGGSVYIGMFNGLAVSIIDIVLNIVVIVIATLSLIKNKKV